MENVQRIHLLIFSQTLFLKSSENGYQNVKVIIIFNFFSWTLFKHLILKWLSSYTILKLIVFIKHLIVMNNLQCVCFFLHFNIRYDNSRLRLYQQLVTFDTFHIIYPIITLKRIRECIRVCTQCTGYRERP